jgi:hypothetical protein
MNLTIDISADLEPRLLQEAAKCGMGPDEYVVQTVRSRLAREGGSAPALDLEQSQLVKEINEGLSQIEWDRYYALIDRRRSGTLSKDEFLKLESLSNRIEDLNVQRMERLAELARLRHTTMPELLDQLGIVPPAVI